MNFVSRSASSIGSADLSAIDFNVKKQPVYGRRYDHIGAKYDYLELNDKYEIVRDNGASMGIVGKKYYVEENQPYVKRAKVVLDSIKELGRDGLLNLDNVVTDFQVFENGKKMKAEIRFPQEIIEPKVGDISQFRILDYDSLDMSWKWGISYLAFRLWCSNGCSSETFNVHWTKMHTAQISNDENQQLVMTRIANCIKEFRDNEKRFERWTRTGANEDAALAVFKGTLAKYSGEYKQPKVSKPKMEELKKLLYKNTHETGWTVWAVYQAATEWASHFETKGKTYNIARDRQAQVAKMLNSNPWKLMSGDDNG